MNALGCLFGLAVVGAAAASGSDFGMGVGTAVAITMALDAAFELTATRRVFELVAAFAAEKATRATTEG